MSRITVCLIAVPALVLTTNAVLAQAKQVEAGFCQITQAEQVAERVGAQDPRVVGVRLLANHQEVEAGDVVKAQLANFSDAIVLSGSEFKIQRYDGTEWHTDPSSPDGPWPRSARKLKPGGVAGCYRYVVPEAQSAGRYRFLTSISERTEQYSKTYYKASEFFIQGVQDGGQMPRSVGITTSSGATAREVRYQLEIQSGAEEAAFGVQYDPPSWPTAKPVFGSPLKMFSVGISGPGSIESARVLAPKPVLHIRNGCIRSAPDSFSQRFWVELPPNSTSTVYLLARGTYPAWPGTIYGVRFSTFAVDDSGAELVPLASVNVPRLMSRGTRIEIKAKGRPRADTTPEIVGRTFPPFRSAKISLRIVRPSRSGGVALEDWAAPVASLGVVQTDGQGRFRVSPRPFSGSGPYAVIARSEARSARVSDWNCGAFFSVD